MVTQTQYQGLARVWLQQSVGGSGKNGPPGGVRSPGTHASPVDLPRVRPPFPPLRALTGSGKPRGPPGRGAPPPAQTLSRQPKKGGGNPGFPASLPLKKNPRLGAKFIGLPRGAGETARVVKAFNPNPGLFDSGRFFI